jgi:hypothetical protein
MNLKLNRNVGIEMEGYFDHNPRYMSSLKFADGAEIKQDGSLYNAYWESGYKRHGVEIVCEKTQDIQTILNTFLVMEREHGWSTDDRAGTHIHVEVADFSFHDKAKMAMFAQSIQPIIHMFSEDYRFGNRYCRMMDKNWSDIFTGERFAKIDWSNDGTVVYYEERTKPNFAQFLINNKVWSESENDNMLYCEKYNWTNVNTQYPTIEFRQFHAIKKPSDIINFANMAVNIIDTVKNSTVEQLKFIALSLWESVTPEDVANNFLHAIGMEKGSIPMVGELAAMDVLGKLASKHSVERLAV